MLSKTQNLRSKNNLGLHFLFFGYEKKTSQKYQKVYQKREGADSPGSFGFEKTRGIN